MYETDKRRKKLKQAMKKKQEMMMRSVMHRLHPRNYRPWIEIDLEEPYVIDYRIILGTGKTAIGIVPLLYLM